MVLTSPTAGLLVGRDTELVLVGRLVHDVRQGQASTLLIEGEAGVGKTRLVDSLIEAQVEPE